MDAFERIEELLDEAYLTDDPAETERLAREILELDDNNAEALILLADSVEYSEEKTALLEKARDILADEAEELLGGLPENILEDETGMLYIAVLQRLGFALFSDGKNEEALTIAREIEQYDPEGETLARTLIYRVLLEMGKDSEVLREALKDRKDNLAAAHARAIATFRLSGPGKAANSALWDAFSAGPEIPFYILGFMPEPGNGSDEEDEAYNFAVLFEDAWSSDNRLVKWLSRAAILLGLTASMFPEQDVEKMMILADALEIADYVEEAMIRVEGRDDWEGLEGHGRIEAALKMFSKGGFLPLEG